MNTADRIRQAVAEVQRLRHESLSTDGIGPAVLLVKRFQARRFAGTYADLLGSGPHAEAARFFLQELYGERDYAERDAHFARIAGAVERLFPRDVAETAAALVELHALTESLDHAMARCGGESAGSVAGYIQAWRSVGRRADRELQLERVGVIGEELARLLRIPGLRLMLKMMRGPAVAAGLGSMQRFLEAGFDTFSAMHRRGGGVSAFLAVIRERERRVLELLFEADLVACETELARILDQAR